MNILLPDKKKKEKLERGQDVTRTWSSIFLREGPYVVGLCVVERGEGRDGDMKR